MTRRKRYKRANLFEPEEDESRTGETGDLAFFLGEGEGRRSEGRERDCQMVNRVKRAVALGRNLQLSFFVSFIEMNHHLCARFCHFCRFWVSSRVENR